MSSVRKIASFARWRLVPVRYATMLGSLKWKRLFQAPPSKSSTTAEIDAKGCAKGPDVPPDVLRQAMDIYDLRGQLVVPKASGHPFVNLFSADDFHRERPVFRFAFSPEVLDAAADYFGGSLILDCIQVLYSYPTEGALRESQYWHLDYGDRTSFNCVAYLKDVLAHEDGPFVDVDKFTTQKIGHLIILRRIPDQQFNREIKSCKVRTILRESRQLGTGRSFGRLPIWQPLQDAAPSDLRHIQHLVSVCATHTRCNPERSKDPCIRRTDASRSQRRFSGGRAANGPSAELVN